MPFARRLKLLSEKTLYVVLAESGKDAPVPGNYTLIVPACGALAAAVLVRAQDYCDISGPIYGLIFGEYNRI